jgi:hypothetical protein
MSRIEELKAASARCKELSSNMRASGLEVSRLPEHVFDTIVAVANLAVRVAELAIGQAESSIDEDQTVDTGGDE